MKDLDKTELMEILDLIAKVYEENGRYINMAVLTNLPDGQPDELLIDNREKEEIN